MALPHARSGDIVAVRPLGDRIAGSVTTALIKSEQLEVIRIVLQAGKSMREHSAPGEITVFGIEGEIELTTPAGTQRIGAGDFVLVAAGEAHALRAIDDATALMTICLVDPRGDDGGP